MLGTILGAAAAHAAARMQSPKTLFRSSASESPHTYSPSAPPCAADIYGTADHAPPQLLAPQAKVGHKGPGNGGVAPHAVVKMFQTNHWRPQSSGRHMVSAWLQDVIMHAGRHHSRYSMQFRNTLHRALIQEHTDNAKHPSRVCPQNCPTPYAFRTWPDKVQVLIAFDRVAGGLLAPSSLRDGTYAPVVLYKPRLTIVNMVPEDNGNVLLVFAETRKFLSVPFETLCRNLRLPRERDAKSYQTSTLAALHKLRDVCGSHESYFETQLLPALRDKKTPIAKLPTFGLCSEDVLKRTLRKPLSPEETVTSLRAYVISEHTSIAFYPAHVFMPTELTLQDPVEI